MAGAMRSTNSMSPSLKPALAFLAAASLATNLSLTHASTRLEIRARWASVSCGKFFTSFTPLTFLTCSR
ncbi:hypothetical protein D3C71_2004400 [compost metagenome]